MRDFSGPYCLVHTRGETFYSAGEIHHAKWLADLPPPSHLPILSMVPYSQLKERGFAVHADDEPIISLVAQQWEPLPLDDLPVADQTALSQEIVPEPEITDSEFEDHVQQIISQEICRGEGSNFLFSRKYRITIPGFSQEVAHLIFQRLVKNEIGAYATFCFFDGERYFIGASPERHLTIVDDVVTMNPICGTLPKSALQQRSDLVDFLSDPKEINELFQVVDEELKMMSQICADGGVITGPNLKEMGSVIHTEYTLKGQTKLDYIDAFRESMFAATMLGSPLENAARIIHKYETKPRRYYSSALLMRRRDEQGNEFLDSAITIRTMEIALSGKGFIQVGASIVRDSIPEKEGREVKAKAAGLLRAISSSEPSVELLPKYLDAGINKLLNSRNSGLSQFWTEKQTPSTVDSVKSAAARASILIVDNEDQFTHMLKHAFGHLGYQPRVQKWDDPELDITQADIVLVGPGPGNPSDVDNPKIAQSRKLIRQLIADDRPFLAVCLGHQILCAELGMQIVTVDPPWQGVQKTIDFFGEPTAVGFYNTFTARRPDNGLEGIDIAAEPDGSVTALRSARFHSFQFHVESVLTTHGNSLLHSTLQSLLS